MDYGKSKAIASVIGLVFSLIGVVAMLWGAFSMLSKADGVGLFLLVWGALFCSAPLVSVKRYIKQLSTFEKMTYDWYKAEHPDHVQGNRVSCISCGNTRINVRALMKHTYHREHFCVQCGKTLYYSPEQS